MSHVPAHASRFSVLPLASATKPSHRLALLLLTVAGFVALAGAGCGKDADSGTPACEATIPGCDVDNNGIRDDVQTSIDERLVNQSERNALRQMARAMQRIIQTTTTAHFDLQREYDRAVVCETYASGYDKTLTDSRWLDSTMFDTPSRLRAYLHFEEQSGPPTGVDDEDAKNCEGVR